MRHGSSPARQITPPCPLCDGRNAEAFHATEEPREYFRCPACALVYLHPSQRLTRIAEHERYLLHENAFGDPGYLSFLERLADPVIARLRPGARGLDFGCGPAPVLSELLISFGFPCAAYDPFFAPDDSLLRERYDFITCSEVVEHAFDPAEMFATLHRLLAPGGMLGVMTTFYETSGSFGDWWYQRDPTHVCFYNEETMRWIGDRHQWVTDFPVPNVTLFTASPAHP